MHFHANAKLGPAGRLALTQAIAAGMSQKAAAAAFCVSPATANRWLASTAGRVGGGAALGRLAA
jgi:transposase